MHPAFKKLEAELSSRVRDLDAQETQAGRPLQWTIQQIVEHLTLTYSATEVALTSRIAKGRPTRARATLRQHASRFLVVDFGYFPVGISAPSAVTPAPDLAPLSGEELVAKISQRLQQLDELLDELAALFGERNRCISHMILGPLSPREWRRFHLVHGLHHLRQIDRIRAGQRVRG